MINYCPELEYKNKPKDREFFYNILNTITKGSVEKLVYNAHLSRQYTSNIPNEMEVAPEWRKMFTSPTSLIGKSGKSIFMMRKEQKRVTFKNKKKKYNLIFD